VTRPSYSPEPRDRKNISPLVWCCLFGASTTYLWVMGLLGNISLLVALPAIYFMVYLLTNSHLARSARRSEELYDISAARELANQCLSSLERLAAGTDMWGEYRVYIALGSLLTRIDLFNARYHRYLDYPAKLAAIESASNIAAAQLESDLDEPIAHAKDLMETIKAGILGVDHPSLRAARA